MNFAPKEHLYFFDYTIIFKFNDIANLNPMFSVKYSAFAECEIIFFENCEILLLRRNVKWNSPPNICEANISHAKHISQQRYFTRRRRISLKKARKSFDLRAFFWSWWCDSNTRPADYESAALPTVLHQRLIYCITFQVKMQYLFKKFFKNPTDCKAICGIFFLTYQVISRIPYMKVIS